MVVEAHPGLNFRDKVDLYLIADQRDILHELVDLLSRQSGIAFVGIDENVSSPVMEIASLKPDVIVYVSGETREGILENIGKIRVANPEVKLIVVSLIETGPCIPVVPAGEGDCWIPKSALLTELLPAIMAFSRKSL